MEINTEISRVFGEEMAKLFASKLSEEELDEMAGSCWLDMKKKQYRYGSYEDSKIEELVKREIVRKLYDKINEILKEPINDEELEKKAREIVERARKVGEETIVKQMANGIAQYTLSAYTVHDKVVEDVMAELYRRNEQNI